MRLGATFPQTEIGSDPVAVRDFAQAVEAAGYDYLLAYDHVLGADPTKHELTGPYTHRSMFHEPFVLFGYLAGLTQRIDLVTGIIILPQRQTALVAKQAAEVDVLSGGRLILGIGIGWNQVEYEVLGADFPHPRAPLRGAGAAAAPALGRGACDVRGRVRHGARRRHPAAPGAAHPDLVRRRRRQRAAPRRRLRRRLAPTRPRHPGGGDRRGAERVRADPPGTPARPVATPTRSPSSAARRPAGGSRSRSSPRAPGRRRGPRTSR